VVVGNGSTFSLLFLAIPKQMMTVKSEGLPDLAPAAGSLLAALECLFKSKLLRFGFPGTRDSNEIAIPALKKPSLAAKGVAETHGDVITLSDPNPRP
jgi:hypothetical protein